MVMAKGNAKSSKKTKTTPKSMFDPQNMLKRPNNLFGNVFFYIFIALGLYMIFSLFSGASLSSRQAPISEVINLIKEERVQDVKVDGDTIEVLLKDGTTLLTKKESQISFDEVLANNGVDISSIGGQLIVEERVGAGQIFSSALIYGLPILLLIFIMRSMRSASSDVFSFGKSKAKMFNKESSSITFDDVAGIEEAKTEMREIVDFLKNPQKYMDVGARIPKGVLLVGPAGVGKTLLAKAIAGEAEVPFFSVAGSEFMEMLVGVGSSRVRDLFKMAKSAQPALIFIDEIDAIGRQRGMGIGGGHDEREQTLNQILIEMDGFDQRTNVIVIAATNRPDMLDPALVRAGRFDRKVTISMPDLEGRKEIIQIHMKGKPFAEDFDLEKVAKKTVGFSGADIENVLNESAIYAAREDRKTITMRDIDNAALKVTMGPERKRLADEHDRKLAAYHEAGHAIVGAMVENLDAVGRVTIVPRGGSLGHTSLPPERDRYNETKTRLLSMIAMIMGGRAAEEIIFEDVTTGASSDFEKATNIARKMVTEWGMSPLGTMSMGGDEERHWLAKQMGDSHVYSQEVAAKVDAEIKNILDAQYKRAIEILNNNRVRLDRVAEVLLDKETIDGTEFAELMQA